eukprot:5661-Heterococcus_DN1.PRE.4
MKSMALIAIVVVMLVVVLLNIYASAEKGKCAEPAGILSENGLACCPTWCGSCGGQQCNTIADKNCCVAPILAAAQDCAEHAAPCAMHQASNRDWFQSFGSFAIGRALLGEKQQHDRTIQICAKPLADVGSVVSCSPRILSVAVYVRSIISSEKELSSATHLPGAV